ncbi:hypothetical protein CKJ61_21160 [Mycobacterium intracellulare]|nr:hypothetical protein CKJ61_21160 [Mycobacterium intracellulare]
MVRPPTCRKACPGTPTGTASGGRPGPIRPVPSHSCHRHNRREFFHLMCARRFRSRHRPRDEDL